MGSLLFRIIFHLLRPSRRHSVIHSWQRERIVRNLARLIATTLLALVALPVGAQIWPDKPVRMIVPFPAGGPTDILARILAQKLTEIWRQQVIVDNRPGAGATIGAELVARASPDGYTLLMTTSAVVVAPSLYTNLTYDPIKDFAPVANVASTSGILVIHPSLPAKSVRDLIALAKARPGHINFASTGSGTPLHLAAELFKAMAGIEIVHIPYKGSAPALADLIGGQVSMMFDSPVSALPHIKSGKLRALGVSSSKRSAAAPDVPAIAETIPGYEASFWYGVLAPAATPREIVVRINEDIVRALRFPDLKERIESLGAEPIGNSVEQFSAEMRSDMPKWARVVKTSGAKID